MAGSRATTALRRGNPPHNGEKHPSEFARLLKEFRQKRDISQARLASLAGVSSGYVGLIETGDRGERPSLEIVKRFAQALGATVPEMERLLRASGHIGPDEQLIPDERPTFLQFVDADPRLNKTQKIIMKSLYESWLGSE